MAKKKEKKNEYEFLKGCNASDGRRFEVGDRVSDLPEDSIKAFLADGAIKEKE